MENNIKAINYHLWEPCNMRCNFCFATFQDVKNTILPKGHLDQSKMLNLIELVIDAGYKKITFAGGEPLLCGWITDLIKKAKLGGMTTMIVTNASLITDAFLDKVSGTLDWIALSIDSSIEERLTQLGRSVNGKPIPIDRYIELSKNIRKRGIRLKLNTVVSSANWHEDMTTLVYSLKPERWKILQVLPIVGQNDTKIEELLITNDQFNEFININKVVKDCGINLAIENNYLMKGSYVMIDPAGRFFDNVDGFYRYSRPILEVGIDKAIKDIRIFKERFIERGGLYDW